MPLSTSSSGSPLTPLASDLSDVGSFSDSDWLDVASSGRGDSDAQAQDSDSDSDAPIQDSLVTQVPVNEYNGLGLQLDVGPQAVTGSEAADEPEESLAISSQSNDVSAESSVLFEAVDSLAAITDSPATLPPPVADDAAIHDSAPAETQAGHAHNPAHDGLRLEFPDPLSSSEEIRMRAMIDSTSTISSWPDIRRDVAVTAAAATVVTPRHVNLHIAVLGHRPSPLRTQRITSLFVEAVADALGVSSSLAQGLTTPHSSGLRQFTFIDEVTKTPQVYRIQVTDDSMDEDVVADKTLAMVFFSATRVLSTVPMLKRLPKDTLVVPLLHSASSAFTPSLLSQTRSGSQSLSASDDGWSAPSSVESSILVSSSGQDSHVRMQQLRIDAEFVNLGVDVARVLNVWPQRSTQFVVVPLHEVDRRSVFRGVREGLFPSAAVKVEEVEEEKPVEVPAVEVQAKTEKAEKVQQRIAINREHAWGAFAILSVLLAVLGSRVFVTSEPPPVFSKLPELDKYTPDVTTTTSIATFVPPLPPSAAPIVHKESSLLSSSLRNFALSVAAAAVEEQAPVAPAAPAAPAEVQPKVSTAIQEISPPAAAEPTSPVEPEAPLTIDPPSFKSRIIPLLPGASYWSSHVQPIASTSKNVDNGEATEPDSVNAAFDALLSVLQRHVKDITKEVCLGETDSARSCVAARQERATANARKIGRAAMEAAPDIADRILARHRRARKNARKVREQVASVAEQVAEWTKVASEQMANRRAARHERIQNRREKWRARRKAWEESHKEVMETTLCRSKVLCGLIGRDRGAV